MFLGLMFYIISDMEEISVCLAPKSSPKNMVFVERTLYSVDWDEASIREVLNPQVSISQKKDNLETGSSRDRGRL